jgi:hypothetical protein
MRKVTYDIINFLNAGKQELNQKKMDSRRRLSTKINKIKSQIQIMEHHFEKDGHRVWFLRQIRKTMQGQVRKSHMFRYENYLKTKDHNFQWSERE